MNDQQIYQKIGKLLWSIMPDNALEIYFTGCIYQDYSAGGTEWQTKDHKRVSFEMGKRPYEIEDKINNLIIELRSLDIFKEKWTHFKVTLTSSGKFNIEFAYIPRENSWVNLYMRAVSDLEINELEEYGIPLAEWEKCVRINNKNK